jgi:hypothetical protein
MAITINGTSGVVYPAGGTANTAGAGVGTTDTQTLTNKTLTSPTISGPTITGTISGSPTITSPTISGAVMSSMASSVITSGTAQASTSGTSINFTDIPSWVKRITVMFSGVSTSGVTRVQIQLGSGSVQTSGYSGQSANIGGTTSTFSAGFVVSENIIATDVRYGTVVLTLLGSNVWTEMGVTAIASSSTPTSSAGAVTLGGTLDRLRITTVNGTDTFDAGSINILYE